MNHEGRESSERGDEVFYVSPVQYVSGELCTAREPGNVLYRNESYQIMGACFDVYRHLGCGFLEAVYHEALAIEFTERNIPFVSRMPLAITYRGKTLKQGYAVDFFLYDKIILEIKAATALCDEHRAQTLNYLKATGKELALLVNFGHHPKLEYQRFVATQGRYTT